MFDLFLLSTKQFWSENWDSAELQDVTVLSIGGSYRDNMVRSGLVSMNGMVSPDRGLSVVVSDGYVFIQKDTLTCAWCFYYFSEAFIEVYVADHL